MIYALGGTGFTFLMTAMGAALVFFFRRESSWELQKLFLGFAAGVMMAASVWSLLIPAMEMSEDMGMIGWIPAAGGFLAGGVFLLMIEHIVRQVQIRTGAFEEIPERKKRTGMLIFSIALHNIPEGMAVGLAFVLATQNGVPTEAFASAAALAFGVGLQNFPEGAAIALPLRQEGVSRKKAFFAGTLSGAVEPAAGIISVLLASCVRSVLPWLLAFAAGTMIFVASEELIPEVNPDEHFHLGTWGVMLGFLLMMILDVALG